MSFNFRVKLVTPPCVIVEAGENKLRLLSLEDELRFPPPASAFIAGYLKQRHVEVEQDDLDILVCHDIELSNRLEERLRALPFPVRVCEHLSNENFNRLADLLFQRIDWSGFDLIAFSVPENQVLSFAITIGLADRVKKETNTPVVLGGRGVWFVDPAQVLKDFDSVDYLIIGKGENALYELCRTLVTDSPTEDRIPGLVYRSNGGIHVNKCITHWGSTNLIPDFKGLDVKAYEYPLNLVIRSLSKRSEIRCPFDKTTSGVTIFPYQFVDGCVNQCAFCTSSLSKCKMTPVEQTVETLAKINAETEARHFFFLNTEINASYKYVDRFCDEIIRSNLDIMWTDSACLENFDEKLLTKMRKAGCIRLWYGVELASDRMLKFVEKRLTVEQAEKGLKMAHEVGIWNGVNLIAGMPYETQRDVELTLEFIERNRDFIDAFEINRFRLEPTSRFVRFPGKFGIRLMPTGMDFEEINGLSWRERKQQTERSLAQLQGVINPRYNIVAQNPYIIFHLYSLFKDKEPVKEWVKFISTKLDKSAVESLSKLKYRNIDWRL